ncbi:hypothetical protein [Pedobacter sp. KACC 23697]|uniref:Uncharacterized protein n=1 Tax=Pedobacter sp. KACC 23697 TaxID=3149230 RepID=A0AAU7K1P8_9SPHI
MNKTFERLKSFSDATVHLLHHLNFLRERGKVYPMMTKYPKSRSIP